MILLILHDKTCSISSWSKYVSILKADQEFKIIATELIIYRVPILTGNHGKNWKSEITFSSQGMASICNIFLSNQDRVTLITSQPLIRCSQNSTYCIVVLIPRLHHLIRKSGKKCGSWRPSLIFFRQIRTLSSR